MWSSYRICYARMPSEQIPGDKISFLAVKNVVKSWWTFLNFLRGPTIGSKQKGPAERRPIRSRALLFTPETNGAFGKPCLCPAKRGLFLTKTAKMTNLRSNQKKNKGFAAQTPWNDENDENGGCHAGKGMVYQKHRFFFPWFLGRINTRIATKNLSHLSCSKAPSNIFWDR